MKRANERPTDDTAARKRALIRSLIEQTRRNEDAASDEPVPSAVAFFRVVDADEKEHGDAPEPRLAEIIPFPTDLSR